MCNFYGTGMPHGVIGGDEPYGLPREETSASVSGPSGIPLTYCGQYESCSLTCRDGDALLLWNRDAASCDHWGGTLGLAP